MIRSLGEYSSYSMGLELAFTIELGHGKASNEARGPRRAAEREKRGLDGPARRDAVLHCGLQLLPGWISAPSQLHNTLVHHSYV